MGEEDPTGSRGMIVAWSEEEIQAIDEENFHKVVVTVVEDFFERVPDPTSVSVVWETETRSHGTRYDVTQPPQLGYDSCYVEIVGGGGGEYRIELDSGDMGIRQYSNDWVEPLTYLELKAPGVVVEESSNTIQSEEIPSTLKEKAIRAIPTIEWE